MNLICITTYNRSSLLAKILDSLKDIGPEYEVLVIDDSSTDSGYESLRNNLSAGSRFHWQTTSENRGRFGYWKTINQMLRFAQERGSEQLIHLSDDAELCLSFTSKLAFEVECLCDFAHDQWVLNFHTDSRRELLACWTKQNPTVVEGHADFYDVGWTDGLCVISRQAMSAIGYKIDAVDPERWVRNPKLGSGAWMNFTLKLYRSGGKFYRTRNSLVKLADVPSVMGVCTRLLHHTVRYVDG
jgi:glycosyltransferase involved in cell wall biosynthesis